MDNRKESNSRKDDDSASDQSGDPNSANPASPNPLDTVADETMPESTGTSPPTDERATTGDGGVDKSAADAGETIEFEVESKPPSASTVQFGKSKSDATIDLGATIDDIETGVASEGPNSGETIEIENGTIADADQTIEFDDMANDHADITMDSTKDVPKTSRRTVGASDNTCQFDPEDVGQTVESGTTFTDDEDRKTIADQTVESLSAGDSGFTIDQHVDTTETLDSFGSLDASDKDNANATLDSADGDALKNRMTTIWGSAESESPGMTIRGEESRSLSSRSTLVIQTRSLRESARTQKSETPRRADYDLLDQLGEGGMGVVFQARQASIDRTVAVKMLKAATATNETQRQKFLSEAVITGELDHPNIVPIYDLGSNDQGALFYSMKCVEGTPWDEKIAELPLHDNVEILMKVADAIAFAHSRGVLHRDLKPENIMLGAFGEVLVMDWGLAVPLGDFRKRNNINAKLSMGGTPAYMAPEMALGPIDKLGFASDVYLLGAILYECLTGDPPHTAPEVMQCLMEAAKNKIVPTDKKGELVDIALKAMETDPSHRFSSVLEFQDAIRGYWSHAESIALAAGAEEVLSKAERSDDYQDFAQAVFGFRSARDLWDGNERAAVGLDQASLAYARSAMRKGDYDLAASLLDTENEAHQDLLARIQSAQQERDARERRLKTARRAVAGMLALVFVVVSVAFIAVNRQRLEVIAQRDLAQAEKKRAEQAERVAIIEKDKAIEARMAEEEAKEQAVAAKEEEAKARREAEMAKQIAEIEREKAIRARDDANNARMLEEKAKIAALAAKEKEAKARAAEERAKLAAIKEKDAADLARSKEAKARMAAELARQEAEAAKERAEEAKRLEELAKADAQYQAYVALIGLAAAKIDENAFDTAALLLDQCQVDLRNWEWGRLRFLCEQGATNLRGGSPVESIALSNNGRRLAFGGWNGVAAILELDAPDRRRVELPHTAGSQVNAIAFSPDGAFVATGSNDSEGGFLRLWDAKSGRLVRRFDGHADAVVSVVFSQDGQRLLTASYDETAALWDVSNGRQIQDFVGHDWWVWSAAFSPDERSIVTASQDGTAIVWSIETGDAIFPPFMGHRTGGNQTPVYTAAFSPDGQWVATGGLDNRVLLWRPKDVQPFDYDQVLAGGDVPLPKFVPLSGHKAAVRSIDFSREGRRILSGSQDNTLRIWDAESHELIKTLRGHDSWVRSCRISDDGKLAYSGGHDGNLKRWNIQGYEEARVLRGVVVDGHSDAVLHASYAQDGKSIITASRDRTARSWRVADGKPLRTFREGHAFTAAMVDFFPDGRRLLTSGVDSTTRVWDVATGIEDTAVRMEGTGGRGAAAISPDGRWIATGSENFSPDSPYGLWAARLWDANTGEAVGVMLGHKTEVTAVAFSPDGELLLSGDRNGRCVLWRRKTGEELRRFGEDDQINSAKFLPDGKHALLATNYKTMRIWNVLSGQPTATVFAHPASVLSMAVSKDGHRVLTSCADGLVRWWDIDSGDLLTTLSIRGGRPVFAANLRRRMSEFGWDESQLAQQCGLPVAIVSDLLAARSDPASATLAALSRVLDTPAEAFWAAPYQLALHPNGETALTVSADDRTARMWNLSDGDEIRYRSSANVLGGFLDLRNGYHRGLVWGAAFSPDGARVATVGGDSARLWTIDKNVPDSRRELMSFSPNGAVACASLSPDGRYAVTASWDNTARVWNAESGRGVAKLGETTAGSTNAHRGRVNGAVFSPDGQFVLTASDDGTAKLWNTSNWRLSRSLDAAGERVLFAAFSPDGTQVLAATGDGSVTVWDSVTAATIAKWKAHDFAVLHAAFSKDANRIITGSADDTARIWQWRDGRWEQQQILAGHTADVTSVAFSKDGSRALTGSDDYSAKLWDASNGTEILTLKGHSREVTGVAFSPDNTTALTCSRDGATILWLTSAWSQPPAESPDSKPQH